MSEYDARVAQTGPLERSLWRRQAGFLGAVLAVAAAVIAAGLILAPQTSAYSARGPWVVAGLLGFVLVLAGACVLFAASLPSGPTRRLAPPGPQPYPDGSFPDASASGAVAAGSATRGDTPGDTPNRGLTVLGSLLGVAGLALTTLALALAVLLPLPTEAIMVQFTDLNGRVQLEYCPTLPGSFAGTASREDLLGSTMILPVKVSAEACGNPEYTDGVWIYLNRASITVSDRP